MKINKINKKYLLGFIAVISILIITGGFLLMPRIMGYESFVNDDFYKNTEIYKISNTHEVILIKNELGEKELYVRGENTYGQLGTLDFENTYDWIKLTHFIPSNIEKIWVLDNSTFITTTDGKLYACGNNTKGKIGISSDEIKINRFTEITIPEEMVGKITNIMGDGNHTIIKTSINKIYGCGDNSYGQLSLPVEITESKAVVNLDIFNSWDNIEIKPSKNFTVAVQDNGWVYFFGDNSNGQSGRKDFPEKCYGLNLVYFTNQHEFTSPMLSDYGLSEDMDNLNFKIFVSDNSYAIAEGFSATASYVSKMGNSSIEVGTIVYPATHFFFDTTKYNIPETNPVTLPYIKNQNLSNDEINLNLITNYLTSYWDLDKYIDVNLHISDNTLMFYSNDVDNTHTLFNFYGINNGENKWLPQEIGAVVGETILTNESIKLSAVDVQVTKNNLLVKTKDSTDRYAYFMFGKISKENRNIVFVDNMKEPLTILEDDFSKIKVPKYHSYIKFSGDINHELEKNKTMVVNFNDINRKGVSIISDNEDVIFISNINNTDALLNAKSKGSANISIIDTLYPNEDGSPNIIDTIKIDVVETPEIVTASFSQGSYSVYLNAYQNTPVTISPEGTEYELRSGNESIVKITSSNSNLIQGVGLGTTEISVWVSGECIAIATVEVTEETFDEVEIISSDVVLKMGEEKTINVITNPTGAKDLLTFKSNDESICVVGVKSGTITPVTVGKTIIEILHPLGFKKVIKVEVLPIDEIDVSFEIISDKTSLELIKGDKVKLRITTNPSGKESELSIKSNNEAICTIDSSFNVEALESGSTHIVISHKDANTIVIPVNILPNVTFNGSSNDTITIGQTKKLNFNIQPLSEISNLTYLSSNTNICTVDNQGNIRGIAEGTITVTVSHPTGVSKQVVITVTKASDSTTPTEQNSPKIVIGNSLSELGYLNLILGGKIKLDVRAENVDNPVFVIDIVRGLDVISIDNEFNIEGISEGTATIKVSFKNKSAEAKYVSIKVKKADLDTDKISVDIEELENPEKEEPTKIERKEVEIGKEYLLKVSGIEGISDVLGYFDDYIYVKTNEKYISYLGNGYIMANYPGETEVRLYKSDKKTLLEIIYVNIPFPDDYFTSMPEAIGIPVERMIQIKFNDKILTSSITKESVFVQADINGNGENIDRVAYVTNNVLNLKITQKDFKETKVYLFITPDVKNSSNISIVYPIVIPISFQ